MEKFNREINPPYTINTCGHDCCKPCLDNWQRHNRGQLKCPMCRDTAISTNLNRSLMDIIESQESQQLPNILLNNILLNNNQTTKDSRSLISLSQRNDRSDLIKDKSDSGIVCLDNSISMEQEDGKILELDCSNNITRLYGVSRWYELRSKILQVVDYNLKRNFKVSYYLLNPSYKGIWKKDIDYIEIDPLDSIEFNKNKIKILDKIILNSNNIRGSTPLDEFTQYIRNNVIEYNRSKNKHLVLSYSIFTDGEPSTKINFEKELKILGSQYPVFLTINLCTENNEIVEYYNDLDKTIGSELGGIDVIDDIESEEKEVIDCGNNFVTYCQEIHVARMAGCYSIASDMLDEEKLSIFHTMKLIKELSQSQLPNWTDRENFIKELLKVIN